MCKCICKSWVRFTDERDNWKHCIADHHPNCPASDWREYTKLVYQGQSCVFETKEEAFEACKEMESGMFELSHVSMPKDVFDKLGEFTGY